MYGNWRPDYDSRIIRRELQIIHEDLHCNAVRICGQDPRRLIAAAEEALRQGIEVWLSPELWNRSPHRTLDYIANAALLAEALRNRWPDQLVLSVGSELTLFMQGIVAGKTLWQRIRNAFQGDFVRSGKHNQPLNDFLAAAIRAVRQVYHGPLTYASLPFERVEWASFDFIGVDHYQTTQIKDKYTEMLQPLLDQGKPVEVMEFGCCTYQGAEAAGGMAFNIIDTRSLILHQIPLLGKFVQPRLRGLYVRDEGLQAREIMDQIIQLDRAGVNGAFVFTFVFPTNPHQEEPQNDLDMASYSLVKSYTRRHGTTYADMPWEPKEAFHAVAEYYGRQPDVNLLPKAGALK
jgi:hypothetical protein